MDDQQRAKELQPCPFCGYAMAEEDDDAYQNDGFVAPQTPVWLVTCPGSDCNASVSGTSKESAMAAWNRRAALRSGPEWQPIDTAPKDDRVLVRCESGSVYAAHWVQSPMTGDEAWLVCALEDGTQMLVHPVEWMPLPLAARPQGVKDV